MLVFLSTISKVIADDTKQIAVFRVLGARRRDIEHAYFIYRRHVAMGPLLFAVLTALSIITASDTS